MATASERPEMVTRQSTAQGQLPSSAKPTLRSLRAAAEVVAIRYALQETRWNRKRAAQLLSISYRGLLYKIRQHNITPEVTGPHAPIKSKE